MENVMEAQKQIKGNAGEVQDFLKDLDNWAAEMKVKDQKLREQKIIANSPNKENSSPSLSSPEPKTIGMKHKPVKETKSRKEKMNIENTKKKNSKEENVTTKKSIDTKAAEVPSPPKKERIKAYEYDKWDKFDVDEECEKIDADASESSSEDNAEEEMEDERLKQQAVAEKERGNNFFKEGKFDKAIERYSVGIQCNPYCAILPANRAMAFLKKKQYGAAEKDASLSLSLDPTYIKALQRRATARTELNKLDEAVQDYQKIVELDPSNKAAKSELDRLKGLAKEKKEKAVKTEVVEKKEKLDLKSNMKGLFKSTKQSGKHELLEPKSDVSPALLLEDGIKSESSQKSVQNTPWPQPDPSLLVKPVQKPPHSRSEKPLRKIRITEFKETQTEARKTKSASKRLQIVDVDGESDKDQSMDEQSESSNTQNTSFERLKSDEPSKMVSIEEISPKSNTASITELKSEDLGIEEETRVVADGFRSKSTGFCRKVEKEISKELEAAELHPAARSLPKTSAQFYRDWREMKTQEQRFEYLQNFTSESYPKIFKSQMDAAPFSEILSVLSHQALPSTLAAGHLLGLSRLPRISALALFLDSKDQGSLKHLLDLGKSDLSEEDLKTVKKAFSI